MGTRGGGSVRGFGIFGVSRPVVTGGTLTSDATYYYRTFTSNGTLTVSDANLAVTYLVVGGGGSSPGGYTSGGGGAGGYISTSTTLTTGSYNVVVGSAANNSTFNSQTAYAGANASQTGGTSGAPTAHSGGTGYGSRSGGGGGGSTGNGTNGTTNNNNGVDGVPGFGGAGTTWINGVTYTTGGAGTSNWYGNGGGDNSGGLKGEGSNASFSAGRAGQQGVVVVAYLKSAVGG